MQQITRTFTTLEIREAAGWSAPDPARLRDYMGDAAYEKLHHGITEYWEIFPVTGAGNPAHGDQFQLVPIVPKPTAGRRPYFRNTSRGEFTQTGSAYFFPSAEAIGMFAAHFGMTLGGADLANGLYSRTGPFDFATAAGARPRSLPSTFTLTSTWDTDSAKRNVCVSLRITET